MAGIGSPESNAPDGSGHFSLRNISDFEKFLAVEYECIYVLGYDRLSIIDSSKECFKSFL